MPTYEAIVPLKDTNGNIVDWIARSRIYSTRPDFSLEDALAFAREDYGMEADVRIIEPLR